MLAFNVSKNYKRKSKTQVKRKHTKCQRRLICEGPGCDNGMEWNVIKVTFACNLNNYNQVYVTTNECDNTVNNIMD